MHLGLQLLKALWVLLPLPLVLVVLDLLLFLLGQLNLLPMLAMGLDLCIYLDHEQHNLHLANEGMDH